MRRNRTRRTSTSFVRFGYRTYEPISSPVFVSLDSSGDDGLEFVGGPMDGHSIGFRDLEMSFDMSRLGCGESFSIEGDVLVDDLAVPVNSEILQILVKFVRAVRGTLLG